MTTIDAVDQDTFRQTVTRFAKCVAVTTTMGPDGPVGCTTTAVLSLSTDPPTMLVSLASRGRTLDDLLITGAFAVNVLAGEQRELVNRFATGHPCGRFDGVSYELRDGLPLLTGTSAAVSCTVRDAVPVLDHTLLIGSVRQAWSAPQSPLVLLDGQPHTAVAIVEGQNP